jgi:hypothetical protein
VPPTEDCLFPAVVAILTPAFLPLTSDAVSARSAAIAAIGRTRATSKGNLLSIAQAIAFGIANLPMLIRSLKPGLGPDALLWLNRNASRLSRARDRHRRILSATQRPGTFLDQTPGRRAVARHSHQTMKH